MILKAFRRLHIGRNGERGGKGEGWRSKKEGEK